LFDARVESFFLLLNMSYLFWDDLIDESKLI